MRYFLAQQKRMWKYFPAVLCVTILLCGSVFFYQKALQGRQDTAESRQKIRLGVVGDVSGSYLGMGIFALKHMDASRYVLELVELELSEAKAELTKGTIQAYVQVPDGFVDSIVCGENAKVTYVTGSGQAGLGTMLMGELTDVISALITCSQAGIYTGEAYFAKEDPAHYYEDTDALNLAYFDAVFQRDSLFEVRETGAFEGLSFERYYLSALPVLLLMLWGLCGVFLVMDKGSDMAGFLYAKGYGLAQQVLAEFLAFWSLMVSSVTAALLLTAFIGRDAGALFSGVSAGYVLRLVPVSLALSALQFLLYEWTDGILGAVLAQFAIAVGLGYLCGCLYPASFFPERVQRLAALLPPGLARRALAEGLLGKGSLGTAAALLLYAAAFLLAAMAVRGVRIGGRLWRR